MAADIQHVVVLMLENRSFDNLLGKLYPADGTFAGLTGLETNIYAGQPIRAWPADAIDQAVATIPVPDPGELLVDMNQQLFGGQDPTSPAPMSGFAANYMAQSQDDDMDLAARLKRFVATHIPMFEPKKPYLSNAAMHYYPPPQVPVITALAQAFGVCDQWHASAPCQTWPNRFFAHTGTALGNVNNGQFPIPFPAPSIFQRLSAHDKTWRVYFHDVPQSLLLRDVWQSAPLHYRFFNQFLADAHTGVLPNYSFIEPRYFTDLILRNIPNDEHPPHNVQYGEELIAQVYNAVRQSPCWKQTLLIITCDEHGGCYDHMPPPRAVPPDGHNQHGFAFDRYGVRVPAVIVSPYVPPGSRIRAAPAGLPLDGPPYPFDHTSILATLRALFQLGDPFTARDAVAPTLLSALSLPLPINDGPPGIVAPVPSTSTQDANVRARAAPNALQASLARMAASLPPRTPGLAERDPTPMVAREHDTVATALADAKNKIADFLNI